MFNQKVTLESIQDMIAMGFNDPCTQQFRDYAPDCPVRSCHCFAEMMELVDDNRSDTTGRLSGHTCGILANDQNQALRFLIGSDEFHYIPDFRAYCAKYW